MLIIFKALILSLLIFCVFKRGDCIKCACWQMRDLKNYGHINVMNAIIEKLADLTEKSLIVFFLFFIEEFRKSVYSIYFLHNF